MSQHAASAAGPERQPNTRTPAAAKPKDGPITESLDADLAAVADEDLMVCQASEQLERRLRDRDLRDELAADGFDGPSWQRFANELARYGWAVMQAWLASGEVFVQCARKRRSVGEAPLDWTDDDRASLAQDTVVEGLRLFRDRGLVDGGWHIDGGASLRTYFIGACILAFPNIYRAWRKHYLNNRTFLDRRERIENVDKIHASSEDPATTAVTKDEVWSVLNGMKPRERSAFILHEFGYSRSEIGHLLAAEGDMPYSEATVKAWLARQRRRSRAQREDGER